jgi:hypothetical protein
VTEWSEFARQTIARVAAAIPETATFAERKAAIDAAYPFGPRAYWPYKAWLKARRTYLAPFDPKAPPPGPLFPHLRRDPVTGRPIIE